MNQASSKSVRARIAVLPGDGVGPEVTDGACIVLRAIAERFGHTFEFTEGLIGGAAIDGTGSALPETTLAHCQSADAVLLGAVGGPQWDAPRANVRPEQGLLGLRQALGCFANLRPVRPERALVSLSPLRPEIVEGVDLLVVRELIGGIYFGEHTLAPENGGERARDVCTYTTAEIERITRVAGALARERRRHITSVDKANVLETSRLWRRVATRVLRDEFPDVQVEHMLVDTCAMQLVRAPSMFDVILTENMFGDILTDEAAVLVGSIGLLPSASLGKASGGARRTGIYEPIHGSAPTIAGTQTANPIGTILSGAMLLRHSLGLDQEAAAIEAAVDAVLASSIGTPDLQPRVRTTTRELAQHVAEHVTEGLAFTPVVRYG